MSANNPQEGGGPNTRGKWGPYQPKPTSPRQPATGNQQKREKQKTHPQSLIDPPHSPQPKLPLEPFKKVRSPLIALVPPVRHRAPPPVRRAQPRLQPHPVRDSLDQPARALPPPIVLKAVHQLVHQDALDLVRARYVAPAAVATGGGIGGCSGSGGGRTGRRRPPDALDVPHAQVDLLVVVVQLRALCVRHARHVLEYERHGPRRGRGVVRPCRAAAGDRGWVLMLFWGRVWAGGFGFGIVVVRLVVVRRDVQQPQDGLDAPRKEGGGVDGGEEARCARVRRVLDVQAELGEGEGVVVILAT